MSEQDVALVRGMLEGFLRGDLDAALDAFDEEIEWDGTNLPDGRISRGRDAIVDHVRRWAEMWESWEVELEEVTAAGDGQVIAFIRESGVSKAGVEVNERHSELFRVEGGRIVYRRGFSDAAEVYAAIAPGRASPGRGCP